MDRDDGDDHVCSDVEGVGKKKKKKRGAGCEEKREKRWMMNEDEKLRVRNEEADIDEE